MRNLHGSPQFVIVKERCYTTLVRPMAEYSCQVWDPHHQTEINRLERIQKRAARFATNNFIMETGNSARNLQKLGWQSLEERRLQTKLITFQKSRLGLLDLPLDHLTLKNRRTRLGGDSPAYAPHFSPVDGQFYSFFPQTTQLWNRLPLDTRTCDDIKVFSSDIKKSDLCNIKRTMSVF